MVLGFCLFNSTVYSNPSELIEIVKRIEAIESEEELGLKEIRWLLEIINSSDLNLHMPVISFNDEQDGIFFAPPSHLAIWTLSRIIENPPYTYEDENWKDLPFHMTGERRRWIEWSKGRQMESIPIRSEKLVGANHEDERRRQIENEKLYMELSYEQGRLQAKGINRGFVQLEYSYVIGGKSETIPGAIASEADGQLVEDKIDIGSSAILMNDQRESQLRGFSKSTFSVIICFSVLLFGILIRVFLRSRMS